MIKLNDFKNYKIHFIGCGGVGMAPMLFILKQKGFTVSGSDLVSNCNTVAMKRLGVPVFEGHDTGNIPGDPGNTLVVYSSAVNEMCPEYSYALKKGYRCLRRGEMLSLLSGTFSRGVAICGSHGKTTVAAMLSCILKEAGLNPGFMIGGKVAGADSFSPGNGDIFVFEADESDGTNALFSPYMGIVTNVEDDHSWSVGGRERLFDNFRIFAENSGTLIYMDDGEAEALFNSYPDSVKIEGGSIRLEALSDDRKREWRGFQAKNAALAVSVAEKLGVRRREAEKALNNFRGVARRMALRFESEYAVLMEDYAHHPTEVRCALENIRSRYPGRKLHVVFQPHRYARLSQYMKDFARELSAADTAYITDVFAAWAPENGVSSADLAALTGDNAFFISGTWDEIAEKVVTDFVPGGIIAVLGAGDIDRILPVIEKRLKDKC